MSNKLELKKLILETKDGKKKIELTVEEARELHTQLDVLFGEKTVNYQPYCPYPTPIIIERDCWPWTGYPPYKVTWGSTNSSGDTATVYGDGINVSYCCSEVN